jgi:hypothetical protein
MDFCAASLVIAGKKEKIWDPVLMLANANMECQAVNDRKRGSKLQLGQQKRRESDELPATSCLDFNSCLLEKNTCWTPGMIFDSFQQH